MTNGHDAELHAWMADWHADAGTAPDVLGAADLRRRVRRRTRGMIAWAAVETTFGVVSFVGFAYAAWVRDHPADRSLFGTLAVLIPLLLWYSLWIRRGTWRAVTETTTAYLELTVLRNERRLASLRGAWATLAIETGLLAAWLWARAPAAVASEVGAVAPARWSYFVVAYAFLAFIVGIAAVTIAWLGARTKRERTELIGLQALLTEFDNDEASSAVERPGRADSTDGAAASTVAAAVDRGPRSALFLRRALSRFSRRRRPHSSRRG